MEKDKKKYTTTTSKSVHHAIPDPKIKHKGLNLFPGKQVELNPQLKSEDVQVAVAVLNKKFENFLFERHISSKVTDPITESLKNKSHKSGIDITILEEVFKRGLSSWNPYICKNSTQEQWAFARVNSFISGGKAVELDSDLTESLRKKKIDINNPDNRLDGTTTANIAFRQNTPGQTVSERIIHTKYGGTDDPCWTGYVQKGTKIKNGKVVPNCVPIGEEAGCPLIDEEGLMDKVYAAGRNFADTATLGGYKYARAGVDYTAKNLGNKLGFNVKPTTYKKELDQEVEKLDKDWKQEPGASLAGIGSAMAVPLAGQYGAGVKTAQGIGGQALDSYGKIVKLYPLVKKALGYENKTKNTEVTRQSKNNLSQGKKLVGEEAGCSLIDEEKEVWDKPNPVQKAGKSKKLSPAQKAKAKARAKAAGRPYPNMVDNIAVAKEEVELSEKSAAWQRKEGKNPKGGLNEKGRKSYERENPGSDLKPPQPQGGARQRSFCARMGGMPGPMKDSKGRPTRKALALRKWRCGSVRRKKR